MSFCTKCGFKGELKNKFDKPLCSFCYLFSPNQVDDFQRYIDIKVPSEILSSYRENIKLSGDQQKNGMIESAKKGEHVSRPPFGYKYDDGNLVPSENRYDVEEIFNEFLNTNQSLRQLAKKRNFSINGLKKILSNFTYIGKIKFDGQIYPGNHEALISTTLFNHVQDKLDQLGIKRIK